MHRLDVTIKLQGQICSIQNHNRANKEKLREGKHLNISIVAGRNYLLRVSWTVIYKRFFYKNNHMPLVHIDHAELLNTKLGH